MLARRPLATNRQHQSSTIFWTGQNLLSTVGKLFITTIVSTATCVAWSRWNFAAALRNLLCMTEQIFIVFSNTGDK